MQARKAQVAYNTFSLGSLYHTLKDLAPEAQTRKRRSELANGSPKRQKVLGLSMMEKIGDGMIVIAKSLAVPTAIDIPAQSESTLQGQTQKLIHPGVKISHTRRNLDYARINSKS
ncbi:hypothetical protein GcM1_202012 [Golovinomyces cichoracearum]|uniref:Uncharacterized protein n=1 Tax=Golovinomyces cichoracearum TaxID=62708 RepID=A0A420IXX8_9PEZI|nr:hypothetical protein GcM1_202012 [Golovinomyces cichoracearum]